MLLIAWIIYFLSEDGFYVTWGASEGGVVAPGQPLPPHGKQLGRLGSADLKQVIEKVCEERSTVNICLYWIYCVCISIDLHTLLKQLIMDSSNSSIIVILTQLRIAFLHK